MFWNVEWKITYEKGKRVVGRNGEILAENS